MKIFFLPKGGVCFTYIKHDACDRTTFVTESNDLKLQQAKIFSEKVGIEASQVMSYLSGMGGYVGTRVYYALNISRPESAILIEEDISMWDWMKKPYHKKP